MKKLLLLLWIIAGIAVIVKGEPSLFIYILCWANLLLCLLTDVVEEKK